ncbi:MAG: SIMPL domain-containing protein [Pseudomonadales bacterium]|nr:SIMPL domain-containing protein [Pseudomonadales bacterium]
MNKLLSLSLAAAAAASLSSFSQTSLAQAQLSGTPDELREFLHPRPNTVNINGEAELTAYKDVAKISLMVTTEERTLSRAMEVNQALRLELIQDFLAAGIPQADINNSKFSSSPQFGLFGRNPNSFEVSSRMEVEVNSEEHLQLLAAAADEHGGEHRVRAQRGRRLRTAGQGNRLAGCDGAEGLLREQPRSGTEGGKLFLWRHPSDVSCHAQGCYSSRDGAGCQRRQSQLV